MNRWFIRLFLIAFCLMALPYRSPAPLIYTPGMGWTYEPVGGEGSWIRTRAKDQVIVAQDAFDKKDYGLALKAARRVVKVWPLSDYAPQAQYLVGRSYEARGMDEAAFKQYQIALEKYPKGPSYDNILKRQYEIANRFLAGEFFRLWNYIPLYRSMDKTAGLFSQIVTNGPFSDLAPLAQLNIGLARVKQSNFPEAVKAYELAADRYNDRPAIASDALYKAGLAYNQQAQTGEYDQGTAAQAIDTFTEFMTLYPGNARVTDAQKRIAALRTEQARGSYQIAQFYEKNKKWQGAKIYYNDVVNLLLNEPNAPLAATAKERIDLINKRLQTASK